MLRGHGARLAGVEVAVGNGAVGAGPTEWRPAPARAGYCTVRVPTMPACVWPGTWRENV